MQKILKILQRDAGDNTPPSASYLVEIHRILMDMEVQQRDALYRVLNARQLQVCCYALPETGMPNVKPSLEAQRELLVLEVAKRHPKMMNAVRTLVAQFTTVKDPQTKFVRLEPLPEYPGAFLRTLVHDLPESEAFVAEEVPKGVDPVCWRHIMQVAQGNTAPLESEWRILQPAAENILMHHPELRASVLEFFYILSPDVQKNDKARSIIMSQAAEAIERQFLSDPEELLYALKFLKNRFFPVWETLTSLPLQMWSHLSHIIMQCSRQDVDVQRVMNLIPHLEIVRRGKGQKSKASLEWKCHLFDEDVQQPEKELGTALGLPLLPPRPQRELQNTPVPRMPMETIAPTSQSGHMVHSQHVRRKKRPVEEKETTPELSAERTVPACRNLTQEDMQDFREWFNDLPVELHRKRVNWIARKAGIEIRKEGNGGSHAYHAHWGSGKMILTGYISRSVSKEIIWFMLFGAPHQRANGGEKSAGAHGLGDLVALLKAIRR